MPPALAPRDVQRSWFPTWLLSCAALGKDFAIRDLSIPGPTGIPFESGDSQAGGTDLVGGGSGPDAIHAWGRILDSPTVSRRITDPLVPTVAVQAVRLKVAERLSGDYVASPFTLSRYDEVSGLRLYECHGIITQTTLDRDGTTIEGTTVDRAILEEQVPVGVVDSTTFPEAPPDSIGRTIPWVFGNVTSLPLICVRDDQANSIFDYLVCRGEAAAITGLTRLITGTPAPGVPSEFVIDHIELEPYPGMDGSLANGSFEDWDAGVATDPDAWALNGAASSVTKTLTAAQVSHGSASAALLRTSTDCFLQQGLTSAPVPMPLSWWQGREMSLVADAWTTSSNSGRVEISDGTGTSQSAPHTGTSVFQPLNVTRTLAATATVVRIRCRVDGSANTTVFYDNVRVLLKAKSMAEILRPDLYPGYTAVRFYLRQEDSSGALYPIVADVNGLQPERNPVRAIRTLQTDPTHSIGLTVDAASFDHGEIATCLTYEDAVTLDAPELFLPFRDTLTNLGAQTMTVRDRSGHERHGVYDKGTAATPNILLGGVAGPSSSDAYFGAEFGNGDWVVAPSAIAGPLSGQAITMELWYHVPNGSLPDSTLYPITEKLIGTDWFSGYGWYRQTDALSFFVRGADANLYTVSIPLVDEFVWLHLVGVAVGGVLQLYRGLVDALNPTFSTPTELVATGSYSGAIAEGWGDVLIAKFGAGSAQMGRDGYDNLAIYTHALPLPRIEAHYAAATLPVDAAPVFADAVLALSPTFHYYMNEPSGTFMGPTNAGSWVGGPTLGVAPSALAQERGWVNTGSMARFGNDIAKYGVKTGLTLNDTAFTLLGFYRPAAFRAQSGLIEKTIGGVRDTQWGVRQTGKILRFTLKAASGLHAWDLPLTHDDVGRATFLAMRASSSTGAIRLYKNGVLSLAENGVWTGPPTSGVGDLYIGCQGTSGGVRTRPCAGDLGHWFYVPSALTTEQIEALWLAATWSNGGLLVDAALTEPRQLQDWLNDIGRLRGIRLDFTPTGTITVSVDTEPTSILIDARDGVGDGDRNIVAISGRQKPRLEDRVRTVVVKYRRDLRTGAYLHEFRRAVSTLTDANGRRIGRNVVFECPAIREHPTADRFCHYAAARLRCEDSVTVTLHQEARRLREGNLIQVTDQLLDYASEIMEVREVNKTLETIEAMVYVWDEAIYGYTPSSFPPGATSG